MSVKVAINGFGRIGRLAFRQMFNAPGYEIVAINDLTKPEMLAHLLKYDTAQGGYCGKIGENLHTVDVKPAVYAEDGKTVVTPGAIIVDGKEITIYAEPKAEKLPWGELGVDVVLECTGFYTSKAKSQAHIDAGAKKVVISAPAGNDLPTIVYGVNENTLTKDDTIISAASCTTNCLAPMAKALNDYAPIQSGIMSTIHAYTGDQMILDGPHRKGDLRRARAGAAKQADLSALGIGAEQIYHFNARFQYFRYGRQVLEFGCGTMNIPAFFNIRRGLIVNHVSQHIKYSSQCLSSHRHTDGFSGIRGGNPPAQAVRRSHGDTAHRIVSDMLGGFHRQQFIPVGNRQRIVDGRKIAFLKANVYHRSHDLRYHAGSFLCHFILHSAASCSLKISCFNCRFRQQFR